MEKKYWENKNTKICIIKKFNTKIHDLIELRNINLEIQTLETYTDIQNLTKESKIYKNMKEVLAQGIIKITCKALKRFLINQM